MILANGTETILIVDDSEPIRVLLRNYLEAEGYNIIEAADGLAALDVCLAQTPDLLLLDIAMPGMDGFTMYRALQKIERLRSIPVIMLTADNDTQTKIQAFQLGAVDYITKPFNPGEIKARIRTHLTISRLTRSLQQANHDLLLQQEQIIQGLQAAADLQKSLLPRNVPDCNHLKFASYFNPCQEVGGDIFNILRIDDEHLALYILDVSGHGFPAAMMTALATQALSKSGGIITKTGRDGSQEKISPPAEVIKELDREFPIDRFNRYMTIFYLVFNTSTFAFTYSCAGHPPPIQISCDTNTLLSTGGPPAGMGSSNTLWESGEGVLARGDRIFFFTDGITEQTNNDGKSYTQERFLASAKKTSHLPLQTAIQEMIGEFKQFSQSNEFNDDTALLAMERT